MRTIAKARVAIAAGVCGTGLVLLAPSVHAQTETTAVGGLTETTAVGGLDETTTTAVGSVISETTTTVADAGAGVTETTAAAPEGGVQAGGGFLAGESGDGGDGDGAAGTAALLGVATMVVGGAMAVALARKRAHQG